jgi:phosphatidylserine/phosphatidylglycerophosphate/cardiolipin synthase-like enzyme
MAEFLTTSGTSYHIENIIKAAKAKLVLVSPYLKLTVNFFQRLKDASNRGVKIIIIYGKDELEINQRNSLADLKGIELYFFQNLHAKCYLNEEQTVITSMNMYEFSEKNNREMGILIRKTEDSKVYMDTVEEVKSIMDSSEKISLTVNKRDNASKVKFKGKKSELRGYCIRCEERIQFNTEKPFCLECFNRWSLYENEDYEESFCHSCGEFKPTSMRKPECYDCYLI